MCKSLLSYMYICIYVYVNAYLHIRVYVYVYPCAHLACLTQMSFLMCTYSYFHKPRTRRQFHLAYPSVPYSFRGSPRTFERKFKV